MRCKCLRSGGGPEIRTPKSVARSWISSPLPCQLRLALRALKISYLRYSIRLLGRRAFEPGELRASSRHEPRSRDHEPASKARRGLHGELAAKQQEQFVNIVRHDA